MLSNNAWRVMTRHFPPRTRRPASGINGTCGTSGQNGWADSATNWGQSSWSATALGSAGFAGKPVVGVCVAGGSGGGAPKCAADLEFVLQTTGFEVVDLETELPQGVPGLTTDSRGARILPNADGDGFTMHALRRVEE